LTVQVKPLETSQEKGSDVKSDILFEDLNEEQKMDARWKRKMSRAMTIISVVEDDHPCWEQVDIVWAEYGLTNE